MTKKLIGFKGEWKGGWNPFDNYMESYWEDGSFTMIAGLDAAGNLVGVITDKKGISNVTGSIKDGKIEFKKTYTDDPKYHFVYEGQESGKGVYKGSWYTNDNKKLFQNEQGYTFEMKQTSPVALAIRQLVKRKAA